LLRIANNLAISKKIREERGGVVQVLAKSVGHQVVDDAVQCIVECQQLLGERDLWKVREET
jgi:TATA-binding protein-associated factor Taf7